jgi:hypothetical protein
MSHNGVTMPYRVLKVKEEKKRPLLVEPDEMAQACIRCAAVALSVAYAGDQRLCAAPVWPVTDCGVAGMAGRYPPNAMLAMLAAMAGWFCMTSSCRRWPDVGVIAGTR